MTDIELDRRAAELLGWDIDAEGWIHDPSGHIKDRGFYIPGIGSEAQSVFRKEAEPWSPTWGSEDFGARFLKHWLLAKGFEIEHRMRGEHDTVRLYDPRGNVVAAAIAGPTEHYERALTIVFVQAGEIMLARGDWPVQKAAQRALDRSIWA